ncbi:hypothetical protein [Legionella maioricensis]|uniref:SidC homolog n=1 Tax=Legionella maioricensis TaxID=2896528 RepID=A0A9X2CZ61_9GAMM|nr:hypothetical protein [Legionella maioricensis]MCL9683145.1 hypothetical protein [Legionella maioricensis]MCL9688044.1 hypothetical protein [Legionella maioricensis]
MPSKSEILNENSVLDEKLFKDSPKTEDTTSHIISFLSEKAIEQNKLQKALSLFAFNKNCYHANQPQRIKDAFVRYVSKNNQKAVQEMLNTHPEFKIHQLLGYIASGNQDEAEQMLKEHPELLLQSGSVIDPSGRHFKNIRPFELLLWTMDVRYMANMVLHCIPQDKKGDEIRIELLKQYKTVIEDFDVEKKTGGVHFTLNGEKHHEKHFDFKPLINALDTYAKNYDDWTVKERRAHWCKVIGKEQRMLPMNVRQHYCDPDESFYPTPTFDKQELKRGLKLHTFAKDEDDIWNSGLIGLGEDFGITRCDGVGGAWEVMGGGGRPLATIDLAAISALCKMRTIDLGLLKKQLEQLIQKSEEIHLVIRHH